MKLRTHAGSLCASLAAACCLAFAGNALAAFPNYTGCPPASATVISCVDIQNTSGNLNIKGFNVPLGESLEIRGGLSPIREGFNDFTPATGTNGFFSRPVEVPGGILGIDFPIPGNSVTATTELAGSASAIRFSSVSGSLIVPVKVRLSNFLLGMNCHIGSNSNPVVLNLITGTTSPPPPNRPISGRRGTVSFVGTEIQIIDNVNVANEFAIPASSSCGLGLGFINLLIDARLQLPSAAGNNSIEVHNNIALRAAS